LNDAKILLNPQNIAESAFVVPLHFNDYINVKIATIIAKKTIKKKFFLMEFYLKNITLKLLSLNNFYLYEIKNSLDSFFKNKFANIIKNNNKFFFIKKCTFFDLMRNEKIFF